MFTQLQHHPHVHPILHIRLEQTYREFSSFWCRLANLPHRVSICPDARCAIHPNVFRTRPHLLKRFFCRRKIGRVPGRREGPAGVLGERCGSFARFCRLFCDSGCFFEGGVNGVPFGNYRISCVWKMMCRCRWEIEVVRDFSYSLRDVICGFFVGILIERASEDLSRLDFNLFSGRMIFFIYICILKLL